MRKVDFAKRYPFRQIPYRRVHGMDRCRQGWVRQGCPLSRILVFATDIIKTEKPLRRRLEHRFQKIPAGILGLELPQR